MLSQTRYPPLYINANACAHNIAIIAPHNLYSSNYTVVPSVETTGVLRQSHHTHTHTRVLL